MESNRSAIKILLTLFITVILIFFLERKFLVAEIRGETLGNYGNISWIDKIVLLIDDFEGFKSDSIGLQNAGFFGYGRIKISLDTLHVDRDLTASKTCVKINWRGTDSYAGWGKGVGKNIDLNTSTDYLNFRVLVPKGTGDEESLLVRLEEDDNSNGILDETNDDSWGYKLKIKPQDKWQLISIPLSAFQDSNQGGDSLLNITRKGGLHTVIFSYDQVEKYKPEHNWYFDFICFTNSKIN
ncbi:MAG: hypothetical protein V4565_13000 [Bacteroidota bacterium]